MKKLIKLLFCVYVMVLPLFVDASVFTDVISWFVPTQLKTISTSQSTERGVGGVYIVAHPLVVSGDTARGYYIPALGTRMFTINNSGQVDLYFNRSPHLRYSPVPGYVPGDISGAYALNVGFERRISIFNPSTTTDVVLSNTDLGIMSEGSSDAQSVFISEAETQASVIKDNTKSLASFTFGFILNNATNKDVYINRSIHTSNFITFAPIIGASTTIKFIETPDRYIAGDTLQVYVVPAGQERRFVVTGLLDNSRGVAGNKNLIVSALEYSFFPTLVQKHYLRTALELRGLSVEIKGMGVGEIMPNILKASRLY